MNWANARFVSLGLLCSKSTVQTSVPGTSGTLPGAHLTHFGQLSVRSHPHHNAAMLRKLCCSLLVQCPAIARSNWKFFKLLLSTVFHNKPTSHKLANQLTDQHGPQAQELRTENANTKSATHLDTGIAEIDSNTSTSRPPRLTALSRHPSKTTGIISQDKLKPTP